MLGIINRTEYLFGLTVLDAMAAAGGAGLKWSRMVEIDGLDRDHDRRTQVVESPARA